MISVESDVEEEILIGLCLKLPVEILSLGFGPGFFFYFTVFLISSPKILFAISSNSCVFFFLHFLSLD